MMLIALGFLTTVSGLIPLPFQNGTSSLQMRDVNVHQIQLVRRLQSTNPRCRQLLDLGARADNNDSGDSGDKTVDAYITASSVVS